MRQITFKPKFQAGQEVFVVEVRHVTGNDGHQCTVCRRSHYPDVPMARVDKVRIIQVDYYAWENVAGDLDMKISYQYTMIMEARGASAGEERCFATLEEAQAVARDVESRT